MPIDYEILEQYGTTDERLRKFFTAKLPSAGKLAEMQPKDRKALEKDVSNRDDFQKMISGWLQEHIVFSLGNHSKYSAVDMAWDSLPINSSIIPLMQYAQGRLDLASVQKSLDKIPNGDKFARRDAAGNVIGVDLPKLTEVNINLIRSVITRRVASQAVKYNKQWPYFKYESRSQTETGRLKADLVSQRVEIMSDQYGYRHGQVQWMRDMLLYGRSVIFPRAYWERDVQLERTSKAVEFDDSGKVKTKSRVVREGISWVNPHPSRIFYDNNYPISSLNTDTGCEFVGFWDVTRWGDILHNPDYFNKKAVSYTSGMVDWFSSYWSFFNQYFTTINPPAMQQGGAGNATALNDRKNQVGLYTGQMENVSTIFTNLWIKVRPQNWGWGTYPYPVWVHLKVAGDATVVYAKIWPSSPCAVMSYNENDSRLMNISLAHELMPFQDQLTNLFSQLLELTKQDLMAVAVLNTDVFPDTEDGKKVLADFKALMSGQNYYASMQLLTVSFAKMQQMGINMSADNIFKVVRAAPNTALNEVYTAISNVLNMAERLAVMSQHEQGQVAKHEISATESTAISESTDTVYDFISEPIEEGRAAMKRIMLESLIACSTEEIELPVANRYPDKIIQAAGFEVKKGSDGIDSDDPVGYKTIAGSKTDLNHEYCFTSRDGGNRPAGAQAADVLVRMIQAIGGLHPEMQNAILSAMGKEKLFEMFNLIFHSVDAGVDLKLQLAPGESNELVMSQDKQVMQAIQRLASQVEHDSHTLAIMQQIMSVVSPQSAQMLQQLTQQSKDQQQQPQPQQ